VLSGSTLVVIPITKLFLEERTSQVLGLLKGVTLRGSHPFVIDERCNLLEKIIEPQPRPISQISSFRSSRNYCSRD